MSPGFCAANPHHAPEASVALRSPAEPTALPTLPAEPDTEVDKSSLLTA